MDGSERRKQARVYKLYTAHFYVDGTNESGPVTLQNLSSGGMAFLYTRSLPEGTMVSAKINFPPADGLVFIKGQVIRAVPRGSLYLTAVGFFEIAEKDREAIDRFAKQFPK